MKQNTLSFFGGRGATMKQNKSFIFEGEVTEEGVRKYIGDDCIDNITKKLESFVNTNKVVKVTIAYEE